MVQFSVIVRLLLNSCLVLVFDSLLFLELLFALGSPKMVFSLLDQRFQVIARRLLRVLLLQLLRRLDRSGTMR